MHPTVSGTPEEGTRGNRAAGWGRVVESQGAPLATYETRSGETSGLTRGGEAELRARLEAYRRGLQKLVWAGVIERERERRRLARWLHDGAIQRLVALRWRVELLGEEDIAAELAAVLDDLRQETTVLHDERDLCLRIHDLCEEHNATFSCDETGLMVPGDVADAVVRVCMEALVNAEKHAKGADKLVRLWRDEEQVTVEIEDNGGGFDLEALLLAGRDGHLGVPSSRALVEALGGVYELESEPGQGCRVRASFVLGVRQ